MNVPVAVPPVREGDVLAGRYRIEKVLGVGGMGIVVAAQHVHLGQQVAVKFLLPEACTNPEAVARFLREARAAVQIQGEHVARVTDVGTLDSGAPYMVMEFLRGVDLEKVVESRGPLSVAEAVGYVLQACEAIAEAHALGIVHRDLKPSNLFMTQRPDGTPLIKVLDFGISKAIDPISGGSVSGSLTATATVLGSPLYMSPEQIRNAKAVDIRADIWSLGIILFQLLTAQVAYEAPTLSGLLAAIVADPPKSLRAIRPDVPPGLELVVMRCLEKDVSRRIPSVGWLARELAPFAAQADQVSIDRIARIDRTAPAGASPGAGGIGGAAGPVTVQVYPSGNVSSADLTGSPRAGATASAWSTSQVKPKSRALLVAMVALAGLTLCGVLGVLIFRRADSPSSAEVANAGAEGKIATTAVPVASAQSVSRLPPAPPPPQPPPQASPSAGPEPQAPTAGSGTPPSGESSALPSADAPPRLPNIYPLPLAPTGHKGAAAAAPTGGRKGVASPRPTAGPTARPRQDHGNDLFNDIE